MQCKPIINSLKRCAYAGPSWVMLTLSYYTIFSIVGKPQCAAVSATNLSNDYDTFSSSRKGTLWFTKYIDFFQIAYI